YVLYPRRPQTFKDCWRSDGFDFHVPESIWRQVIAGASWRVPGIERVTNPVLCLSCFDRRAERVGINYSGSIVVMGRRSWLAGRPDYRRRGGSPGGTVG